MAIMMKIMVNNGIWGHPIFRGSDLEIGTFSHIQTECDAEKLLVGWSEMVPRSIDIKVLVAFFWFVTRSGGICCNALQCVAMTPAANSDARRQASCFSQWVDPLAVPFMDASPGVKNTTRSAGVQSLLSFESEFAFAFRSYIHPMLALVESSPGRTWQLLERNRLCIKAHGAVMEV